MAMSKIVDFLRTGYPDGVPRTGYVPLFALLRRRLCDDDLGVLAGHVCGLGPPILPDDIGPAIRRILHDEPSDDDLLRAIRHLADAGWLVVDPTGRVLAGQDPCVGQVFPEVCAAAVELIPGADVADVMLVRGGDAVSVGATSDLATRLTDAQRDAGEGPCVVAATDTAVIRTDDLATDGRWPRYAPAAVELGVRSCLSFTLYRAGSTAAAMNVYGFGAHAWDHDAEAVGAILAAHAAAAISASVWGARLDSPLCGVERVGQAKGIIMARYGLDEIRAFEMLRRLSKEDDFGLVDTARRVIDTTTPMERSFQMATGG